MTTVTKTGETDGTWHLRIAKQGQKDRFMNVSANDRAMIAQLFNEGYADHEIVQQLQAPEWGNYRVLSRVRCLMGLRRTSNGTLKGKEQEAEEPTRARMLVSVEEITKAYAGRRYEDDPRALKRDGGRVRPPEPNRTCSTALGWL